MELEERILGCLFGGAVGDAFGYPIEFDSVADIERRLGGPKHDVDAELVISDDTQMTLFTVEGMIAAFRDDPSADPTTLCEHIFAAYLRWAHTQGVLVDDDCSWGLCTKSVLRARRAPGRTCLSALQSGVAGTTSDPINESKGCGGVMRIAPIGLLVEKDASWVFESACGAAALTHGHPSGWLASGAFARIVHALAKGKSLNTAVNAARRTVSRCEDSDEVVEALDAALGVSSISELGEGWIAEEALAMAVFAAAASSDFLDVLRLAANHDGDSDSTASLAGQLHGAQYGFAQVERWVDRLDAIEEVDQMAARLVDVVVG